eukprot:489279_1
MSEPDQTDKTLSPLAIFQSQVYGNESLKLKEQQLISKQTLQVNNDITNKITMRDNSGPNVYDSDVDSDEENDNKEKDKLFWQSADDENVWIIFDTHGYDVSKIQVEFKSDKSYSCKNIGIYCNNNLNSKFKHIMDTTCDNTTYELKTQKTKKHSEWRLLKLCFYNLTDDYISLKGVTFYGSLGAMGEINTNLYYNWEQMDDQQQDQFVENKDAIDVTDSYSVQCVDAFPEKTFHDMVDSHLSIENPKQGCRVTFDVSQVNIDSLHIKFDNDYHASCIKVYTTDNYDKQYHSNIVYDFDLICIKRNIEVGAMTKLFLQSKHKKYIIIHVNEMCDNSFRFTDFRLYGIEKYDENEITHNIKIYEAVGVEYDQDDFKRKLAAVKATDHNWLFRYPSKYWESKMGSLCRIIFDCYIYEIEKIVIQFNDVASKPKIINVRLSDIANSYSFKTKSVKQYCVQESRDINLNKEIIITGMYTNGYKRYLQLEFSNFHSLNMRIGRMQFFGKKHDHNKLIVQYSHQFDDILDTTNDILDREEKKVDVAEGLAWMSEETKAEMDELVKKFNPIDQMMEVSKLISATAVTIDDLKNMTYIDEELVNKCKNQQKMIYAGNLAKYGQKLMQIRLKTFAHNMQLSPKYATEFSYHPDVKQYANPQILCNLSDEYIEAHNEYAVAEAEVSIIEAKFKAYVQPTLFEQEELLQISEQQKEISVKYRKQWAQLERDKLSILKSQAEEYGKLQDEYKQLTDDDEKDKLEKSLEELLQEISKSSMAAKESGAVAWDISSLELKEKEINSVYIDKTKEDVFIEWKQSIDNGAKKISNKYNVIDYESMIRYAKQYKPHKIKNLFLKLFDGFKQSLQQKKPLLHRYHVFQLGQDFAGDPNQEVQIVDFLKHGISGNPLDYPKQYEEEQIDEPFIVFDCKQYKIGTIIFVCLKPSILKFDVNVYTFNEQKNEIDYKIIYSGASTDLNNDPTKHKISIDLNNDRYIKLQFNYIQRKHDDGLCIKQTKFYGESDDHELTDKIKVINSTLYVDENVVTNMFDENESYYQPKVVAMKYTIEEMIRDEVCCTVNKLINNGTITKNEKDWIKYLLCFQNKSCYNEILFTSKRVMNILSKPLILEYQKLQK